MIWKMINLQLQKGSIFSLTGIVCLFSGRFAMKRINLRCYMDSGYFAGWR